MTPATRWEGVELRCRQTLLEAVKKNRTNHSKLPVLQCMVGMLPITTVSKQNIFASIQCALSL